MASLWDKRTLGEEDLTEVRCDPTKFLLFSGQALVCSLSILLSPGDFGTIPGNVKTPLATLEAFLWAPGSVESQSVFSGSSGG